MSNWNAPVILQVVPSRQCLLRTVVFRLGTSRYTAYLQLFSLSVHHLTILVEAFQLMLEFLHWDCQE